MKRILVIGCPGAGKSTFSRKLADKTKLPLYHLDMIWHKSDKTTVTREEFDKALGNILMQDEWIIDGNYGRTLEPRLKACDTVFLFDLPTDVCLKGAMSRIGKKREDMPWVEDEFDPKFKQWIIDFSKNEMPHVLNLLERHSDKDIVIFKSHSDVDKYFN